MHLKVLHISQYACWLSCNSRSCVCCRRHWLNLLLQAKVEDKWNALKKKMAAAEYAGKTPAKIKEVDMENLGRAQKEQQALEQQLRDMQQLLQ